MLIKRARKQGSHNVKCVHYCREYYRLTLHIKIRESVRLNMYILIYMYMFLIRDTTKTE